MVVGGDLNQSDRGGSSNGLAEFVLRFQKFSLKSNDSMSGIKMCQMSTQDVERSPIVNTILQIFGDIHPNITSGTTTQNTSSDFDYEKNREVSDDSAIIPKKDFYPKNRPLW